MSPGRDPGPGQAEWLDLAADVIDAAYLRADARRNVLCIARCLGWSAQWHTGRTRPTVARLMEVSGLSERTVQRWLRWLEDHELLDVLEPGTTAQYRPAILALGTGNLAREWRLTRPPVQESGTPPLTCDLDLYPARTREARPEVKTRRDRAPRGLALLPPYGAHLHRCPQTRSEGLAAARAVQSVSHELRQLSSEHVRHLAREYFAAGWTPADVVFALDHEPGGRQHRYAAEVRLPAPWARHRLGQWRNELGRPQRSASQRRTAAHEVIRAEQAGRRQERQRAAERAAGVDVAARVGQLRAIVAEVQHRQASRARQWR